MKWVISQTDNISQTIIFRNLFIFAEYKILIFKQTLVLLIIFSIELKQELPENPWGKLSVQLYFDGMSLSYFMAHHKYCTFEHSEETWREVSELTSFLWKSKLQKSILVKISYFVLYIKSLIYLCMSYTVREPREFVNSLLRKQYCIFVLKKTLITLRFHCFCTFKPSEKPIGYPMFEYRDVRNDISIEFTSRKGLSSDKKVLFFIW